MTDTLSSKLRKSISVAAVLAVVAFCIFCIGYAIVNGTEIVAFDSEKTYPFSDGWTAVSSAGEETDVTLPANVAAEKGESYSIYKIIPEGMPKPSVLCFRSSHQTVRVFIDDEVLYEYGTDPSKFPFGRSPGSAWNLVRLPDGAAGRRLEIQLTAQYSVHAGWIDEIIIGSKASLLFKLLKDYFPAFAVCIVILVCGIAMVLLHIFLVRKHTANRDMLLLGMFSIFVSCWMLGEIKLVQFFVGNQIAAFTATVIFLMAAPIPLIKFVGSLRNFRYKAATALLVRSLYVIIIIVLSLQIFNILDFMDIMTLLTSLLFIITAASMILVLFDFLKNKNNHLKHVAISLFCLGALSLVELASWTYLGNKSGGNFLRVGVLIFILIQAMIAAKNGVRIFRLSRMAGLDALTGCRNRMSFSHRLAELKAYKNVGVVMADLNNLKLINDTHGHEMGDDSIIRCARRFEEAFSTLGDCYRIGGDEFLFVGVDAKLEILEERVASMQACCEGEALELSYPFEIATGCAVFDPEKDEDISATIRRADGYMYENKLKKKKASGQENCENRPHSLPL